MVRRIERVLVVGVIEELVADAGKGGGVVASRRRTAEPVAEREYLGDGVRFESAGAREPWTELEPEGSDTGDGVLR